MNSSYYSSMQRAFLVQPRVHAYAMPTNHTCSKPLVLTRTPRLDCPLDGGRARPIYASLFESYCNYCKPLLVSHLC